MSVGFRIRTSCIRCCPKAPARIDHLRVGDGVVFVAGLDRGLDLRIVRKRRRAFVPDAPAHHVELALEFAQQLAAAFVLDLVEQQRIGAEPRVFGDAARRLTLLRYSMALSLSMQGAVAFWRPSARRRHRGRPCSCSSRRRPEGRGTRIWDP